MSYTYSTNEEEFYGEFDTELEALKEVFDEDCTHAWIGESEQRTAADYLNIRDAENLMEAMNEMASDECGECAEDWLLVPFVRYHKEGTPERDLADLRKERHDKALKALDTRLRTLINQWADDYGLQPEFFHVKNVRKVLREEFEEMMGVNNEAVE